MSFTVPDRAEVMTIYLGPYLGDPRYYTFPVRPQVRVARTKIFPKRANLGPTDLVHDDTLSSLNFMDLSGGQGIAIINPASDLGKTWWHVADARGTDGWTTPPEAISRKPASYSGNCVPLGRLGASSYALWGTAIHQWDPDAQTVGASLGTVGTVVNTEGIVVFNNTMYFPLGASGYSYVAESAPGTLGAITTVTGAAAPTSNSPVPTSNPRVHAFAVHQQKLWAITTAADGHVLASSLTGATASWNWPYDTSRPAFIKIETSAEPRTLFEFTNVQQTNRALWCACRRGCLIYDPGEMTWQESNLWDVPPHPDFGRAAKVFRPGEAAWISSGGGDAIQYTASGVVVPASGPGGNGQGMPAGKRGSIVSFASDLANMYALVKGETPPGSSASITEDTSGDDPLYIPDAVSSSSVIAYTGKGWHPLWESSGAGVPTKIVVADAVKDDGTVDYRAFWGVGEEMWSMACRLTTYSSRQAIHLGLERFASSGYIEWGEFHGGSIANKKLASHVSIFLSNADAANYVEYDYQTNAQQDGSWITLGRAAIEHERVVLPFGVSADGLWSAGLSWHWIKQRLRFIGQGGTNAPVVSGISLAYMPLPQDAASHTYTVPLPVEVCPWSGLTREQIVSRLEAHVQSEEFLLLKFRERTFRAYVASFAATEIAHKDAPATGTLTLIQIPTDAPGLLGQGEAA